MNHDRCFVLAAESALAAGRPLDAALEAVCERLSPPGGVASAIAFAREGRLRDGLRALEPSGFDPLVAEAACLHPEATRAVDLRLSTLPPPSQLTLPSRGFALYIAALSLFQGLVASIVVLKVLPTFARVQAEHGVGATWLNLAPWIPLVHVALFMAALFVAGPGARLLARRPRTLLEAARAVAAAEALASHGALERGLKLLAGHERILGAELATAATPAVIEGLSQRLAEGAISLSERRFVFLKSAGTAAAVLAATLLAASVYLFIPLLSGAVR